jgi:hypothetical protein
MPKRPTHAEFKRLALRDPELKRLYEAHDPEFDAIDKFIEEQKTKPCLDTPSKAGHSARMGKTKGRRSE